MMPAEGSFTEPHVCGWSVKEFECQEIEVGPGNLCKTVADRDTCNQQGDCCWDMKGYCGEFDRGDCMTGRVPILPNMPVPPVMDIGGIPIIGGMEEMVEAKAEVQENKQEFAREQQEAKMEGEMMEFDFEELPFVQSCDNLPLCHGRVGFSPCILDSTGTCVKMAPMTPFSPPPLRQTHESNSQSSSPYNYGHLLMVLGGGLIVGLAAGVCVQGLRSKNSIAPVLLEDNYRNI